MNPRLRLAVFVTASGTQLITVPIAGADTSATCTTDTSSSYCEQVDQGTQGTQFLNGFGVAEIGGATLFVFILGFVLFRKLLSAAGI